MASEKREADGLIDEPQALAPKQQKTFTQIPNFHKPLKIVIVNRRARPDTTKTTAPPHLPSTSPSKLELASKKRKADTLVKDMRALAKHIQKKHKPATKFAKTSTPSRKPLKIVIVNRRKPKGKDNSESVNENGTEDNLNSNRPRLTFLDLPRELRQSILLLARPWRTAWIEERKWMNRTISVFKEVHPRLLEDVEYVKERWMRLLTDELKGAGFTWESLKSEEKLLVSITMFHNMRIGRACEGDSGTHVITPEQQRPKASFLSLPHKLRQSILLQTERHHDNWAMHRTWIQQTAATLRTVHPDIVDDVAHVEDKWMDASAKELKMVFGEDTDWEGFERRQQVLGSNGYLSYYCRGPRRD
ncbi:hypothetical protein BLS_002105 [Venturia inaequalis]|uniref:Uncharacterized protein n=1 Tax=Venturia inaequalis TaxID=5025 RepID=A0A8H3YWB1_VENIN|nr:hypothetical protein BLS_002105 [Venturia inaequalis]